MLLQGDADRLDMNYVYVHLLLGFLCEIEIKKEAMVQHYKQALQKAHATLP